MPQKSKPARSWREEEQQKMLKRTGARFDREHIERRLQMSFRERMNFLRKRLPNGGSVL